MLNRRRLIHSKLHLKDRLTGLKKKQVAVALSGIPSPGDGSYQAIPAQVQVFKENYDPCSKSQKSFPNPKLTISLKDAQISVLGSPSHVIKRRASFRRVSRTSCSFLITTSEGICFELTVDDESQRLVWVTVLEFLAMFPYSSVPEVPKCNPVLQTDLDPNLYNADSAWPVYILPEEVGSRCSIIGSNVLALHGRIEGTYQGKMEIYSPTDHHDPVITWDHDKIRRTGKLGRLLFVEIGRRCTGGPGLVWMYIGTNDKRVYELRDLLRRFLFEAKKNPEQQSPTQTSPTQITPIESTPIPFFSAALTIDSTDTKEDTAPPLPPLRRSISNPGGHPMLPKLHHNYHILEPIPS